MDHRLFCPPFVNIKDWEWYPCHQCADALKSSLFRCLTSVVPLLYIATIFVITAMQPFSKANIFLDFFIHWIALWLFCFCVLAKVWRSRSKLFCLLYVFDLDLYDKDCQLHLIVHWHSGHHPHFAPTLAQMTIDFMQLHCNWLAIGIILDIGPFALLWFWSTISPTIDPPLAFCLTLTSTHLWLD